VAALWLCVGLLAGCNLGGLVGTRIEVRGAQRSLEEQVLGAFERVGQEVYLLAGVRSVDPVTGTPQAPPPTTESEARALRARRRMEFNRDDVLEFKRNGYVGEGSDGLLVPFESEMQRLREQDPRGHALVLSVVEEENQDRLIVMERIVATNPDLRGQGGLMTVQSILAAKHREEAEPGMKVQMPDGEWVRRGEGAG
jgi:hypothetical protein